MNNNELLISWIQAGMVQIPFLLVSKYRQIGLEEKELVLLLQLISFSEKGNEFPTPEEIAERMTISSTECSTMLRKLVQLRIIEIEESNSDDGVRYEKYSLTPLWLKIAEEITVEKEKLEIERTMKNEQDIYTTFEKEFGRPLSPIECESLAMWIDQDGQDPVIIKAALREAVMAGKVNFRYIDRILFDWKKNGIETLEQARVHAVKFRQKSNQVNQNKSSNSMPLYNWLEQ